MASRDFLFIQSTTEVGGAETVLLNLLAASPELARRSLVATLGFGRGDLPQRLRRSGVEVAELSLGRLRQPLSVLRGLGALRSLARERRVRVVVGNGSHPQTVASVVARTAGARSVFFVHMIHHLPIERNEPIDIVALRGACDLQLANSQASLRALESLSPAVPKRLLYPGVEVTSVPEEARAAARAELGAEAEGPLFGVFGRLQRWKGQDVFVEAAAQVARAVPGARFAVVGGSVFGLERAYAEALQGRARALGLEGRLRFTGNRTDVARLMAACDVVCHTSRVPEPFGMVVVEAMAQGRPVIATRGGGPSEILEGGAGLLVEPEAPEQLAGAMLRLAGSPEERRALGQAGHARARERFGRERMAQEFLRHVEGLA